MLAESISVFFAHYFPEIMKEAYVLTDEKLPAVWHDTLAEVLI